jgi:hypothetical protein
LLTTKSPSSSSAPSPHYHNDNKSHTTTFDDLIQVAESPTTTHVSPSPNDLPSPTKRRRNHSQTNGNTADILLKQLLGRQTPLPNTPNDIPSFDNNSTWSSPASVPLIKTESNNSDDSSSTGQTTNTNKLRSDIFLRVSEIFSVGINAKCQGYCILKDNPIHSFLFSFIVCLDIAQ